jgi:hypothetical protein
MSTISNQSSPRHYSQLSIITSPSHSSLSSVRERTVAAASTPLSPTPRRVTPSPLSLHEDPSSGVRSVHVENTPHPHFIFPIRQIPPVEIWEAVVVHNPVPEENECKAAQHALG